MRSFLIVALGAALAGLSLQQCSPGCLRCSNTNQCLACDTLRNTFLENGSCFTSTLAGCQIMGPGNKCQVCAVGFYLDGGSQTCVAVQSSIVNCAVYSSPTQCKMCVDGAIMLCGQCRLAGTVIPGCRTYNSDGTCNKCAPGLIVAANMTACAPLNITNCATGSFIRCRACLNGHMFNNNTYLFNLFQYNMASAQAARLTNFRGGPWAPQSFCQSTCKQTCIDPSSLNCVPAGLQQTAGTFDPNTVANCLVYGANFACTACAQGFKLTSSTRCDPVTEIPNCIAYNTASATDECMACAAGMYVNAQNTCTVRTKLNIPGCVALSNTTDACAACNAPLILSTDGLACFQPIPNCVSHLAITAFYPANNCIMCRDGFFVNATRNGTICSNGTVPNCTTYNVYDNSCTVCAPGTYLNNFVCVPFKQIPNCLRYTITTAVQCKVCNGTRVPFKQLNRCVPMTPRANCIDYSADGTVCTACNGTNYVNANGACVAIPVTAPNCIVYDSANTQCSTCAPGFNLNTTVTPNVCSVPFDYVVGNRSWCAVVNNPQNAVWNPNTPATQITCSQCNDTTFPYAPNFNEAICTNNAQLWYLPGYAAVTNCVRYGRSLASGNPMVCMECAKSFFLSGYQALGPYTTATTCVSSCTSTAAAPLTLILDDFFGFINICVPILATGYVQLSSTCAKYIRSAATYALSTDTNYASDFTCLNVTASASGVTYPTNFLLYDTAASLATATPYEKQVYNAPVFLPAGDTYNPVWDFSNGFANTVDTNLTYPVVFNYRGLLTANFYQGPAYVRTNAAGEAIAAANVKFNNFSNCDIITNTDTVKVGNAFFGSATLYAPATVGTTYYHCFRCAFGYGLAFAVAATAAATSPFPSCGPVSGCATSQVWGGLSRFLNSILSCHSCASTSVATGGTTTVTPNFPTVHIEVDGVTGSGLFVGFPTDQAFALTNGAVAVSARSGFKCLSAPTTVVAGKLSASTVTIPACAAYANFRVLSAWATASTAATVVTSDISAVNNNVCLACKPGTFPTYLSTSTFESTTLTTYGLPGWVVTACTASQYCDATVTTGMFNGCPRCDPRMSPSGGGSVAYNDFTFANCVYTSAMNCLVAEGYLDANLVLTCTVCKSGFVLTAGGLCDQIQIPNQAAGSTFAPNAFLSKLTTAWLAAPAASTFAIRDLRIAYLHKFNATNYGANNCTTNYTRSPISANVYGVCAFSFFLNATRMRSAQTGFFVPNCNRYQAVTVTPAAPSTTPLCVGCLAPFVPSQDGNHCVLFPLPTLCVVAANVVAGANAAANAAAGTTAQGMPLIQPNASPLCFQCAPGAIYVNGLCFGPSIPNCLTYTQTTTTGTLPITCAVCNDTFAPTADSQGCVKGPVDGCRRYSDGLTCTACMPGLILTTLNNRPYCLPIPPGMNCTNIDASQANQFNLQCTRCNNTNVTAYTIAPYTTASIYNDTLDVCLPYNNISNCIIMAQAGRNAAGVVQMGCQVCAPGLYWDASTFWCRPRTVLPVACATFSLNADLCTACGPNFFLSTDGASCTPFPVGFLNCFSQSSPGTCGQCVTGYFLNGGLCIQVSIPVQGCLFYVNDGVCGQCGLGQVAVRNGTQCAFPVVTNCTTWVTPNSCASCPPTTYLANSTAGLGVCLNLTVANCSVGFANGTCSQCLPGFFLKEKVCTPLTTNIPGCAVYANASSCAACNPGFVLSLNALSCIPNYFNGLADSNCADSFIAPTPVCTACNPGYFFNQTGACVPCGAIPAGCAYCSPSNPDQCLMCASGYTMDANFACVVTPSIPNNPAALAN